MEEYGFAQLCTFKLGECHFCTSNIGKTKKKSIHLFNKICINYDYKDSKTYHLA